MAKSIKKAEPAATAVTNISPAAMKVILAKIKASNPGSPQGKEAFVRGPSHFAQTKDFYKFSRPGESDAIISIQGGGFKVTADIVKDISAGKKGL
jgi:hypothetical protein